MVEPSPSRTPGAAVAERSPFGGRVPLITALLVVILALIVMRALRAPDYYNDNSYNLGVALHNAGPTRSLLETSAVNLFYEPFEQVRPESWHRGLYVLFLSRWARLFGSSEGVMRVPHLLLVGALLVLFTLLFRTWAGQERPLPSATLPALVTGFALGLFLLDGFWLVLARAWLDDMAATVATLAGILCVLHAAGARRPMLLAAGACFGLAAFCKDLYLLWGPIGVTVVALLPGRVWGLASRRLADRLIDACCCGAGCVVVLLPRFYWSYVDFGTPLFNPVREWVNVIVFGNRATHALYFLTGDHSPASPLAAAGGDVKVLLFRWFRRAVLGVAHIFVYFAPLWGLLLAAWLPLRRRPQAPPPAAQATAAFAVAATAFYSLFFLAGLGVSTEWRYWIVPVLLALALLVYTLGVVLPRIDDPSVVALRRRLYMATAAVGVVLLAAAGIWLPRVPHAPLSDAVVSAAHAAAVPDGVVLADLGAGDYYYRRFPRDRVVIIDLRELTTTPRAIVDTFLDRYRVAVIVSTREDLRLDQFEPVAQVDGVTLLRRARATPS